MRNAVYLSIGVILLVVGAYYLLNPAPIETGSPTVQTSTYSGADIGLAFEYRAGGEGYVLEERMPVDLGEEPIKVIILQRAEDAATPPPIGGEGPPVMVIAVFTNAQKQFPRMWADANQQYSNINLLTGAVAEAVVGGANSIRYMADGLYASENVVVVHGENVYVITGQFMEQDSELRRDFEPLLTSIRFIPKSAEL